MGDAEGLPPPVAEPRTTPSAKDVWQLRRAGWVVAVGGFVTLLVGVVAIVYAPRWPFLVDRQLKGADEAAAEANVRDAGLRLATGIAALSAGVLAWGRLELSRREHRLAVEAAERAVDAQQLATRTQQTSERGQITERYTRAVEQLGSDNLAVRLGALYALEAVARDSADDAQMIYDVIVAFAKLHMAQHDPDEPRPPQPADYTAALTIALRSPDTTKLDLSGMSIVEIVVDHRNWTGLDLSRCELVDVHFIGCNLTGPHFFGAALADCSFFQCTIDHGHFSSPDTRLVKVTFTYCKLDAPMLTKASFHTCTFTDTTLREGNAAQARFRDCTFEHATLERVPLNFAELDNVRFDDCILDHISLTHIRGTNLVLTEGEAIDVRFPPGTFEDVYVHGTRLIQCQFPTLDNVSFDPDTYFEGVLLAGDDHLANATEHAGGRWYSGTPISNAAASD